MCMYASPLHFHIFYHCLCQAGLGPDGWNTLFVRVLLPRLTETVGAACPHLLAAGNLCHFSGWREYVAYVAAGGLKVGMLGLSTQLVRPCNFTCGVLAGGLMMLLISC
jgi:hypothetical protein